jgi:hypothetical protein
MKRREIKEILCELNIQDVTARHPREFISTVLGAIRKELTAQPCPAVSPLDELAAEDAPCTCPETHGRHIN